MPPVRGDGPGLSRCSRTDRREPPPGLVSRIRGRDACTVVPVIRRRRLLADAPILLPFLRRAVLLPADRPIPRLFPATLQFAAVL